MHLLLLCCELDSFLFFIRCDLYSCSKYLGRVRHQSSPLFRRCISQSGTILAAVPAPVFSDACPARRCCALVHGSVPIPASIGASNRPLADFSDLVHLCRTGISCARPLCPGRTGTGLAPLSGWKSDVPQRRAYSEEVADSCRPFGKIPDRQLRGRDVPILVGSKYRLPHRITRLVSLAAYRRFSCLCHRSGTRHVRGFRLALCEEIPGLEFARGCRASNGVIV